MVDDEEAAGRWQGRLEKAFSRRNALICYAPVGDPLFHSEFLEIYGNNGVDILEIGLPSAHPYADGPTVRASMARSLKCGMDAAAVMAKTAEVNRLLPDVGKVWMCYDNTPLDPLEKLSEDTFPDGLLMVGFDPFYQHRLLRELLRERSIRSIGFVGCAMTDEEMEIAVQSEGYVMLQAKPGLTGASCQPVGEDLGRRVAEMRAAGLSIPIAAGIGISTPEDVLLALAHGCDGVIVGSAALEAAQQGPRTLDHFLTRIRRALDSRQI